MTSLLCYVGSHASRGDHAKRSAPGNDWRRVHHNLEVNNLASLQLSLIYANVTEDDILLRSELDFKHRLNGDKFKVFYTLDKPPEGEMHSPYCDRWPLLAEEAPLARHSLACRAIARMCQAAVISYNAAKPVQMTCLTSGAAFTGWTGGKGFVTADMCAAHLPPPGPDTLILRCGPAGMNQVRGVFWGLGFRSTDGVVRRGRSSPSVPCHSPAATALPACTRGWTHRWP